MNRPTVILDLDGTLIDVSRRHYSAYEDAIAEVGGRALPFGRYWELKRAGRRWPEILGDEQKAVAFLDEFRRRIEQPSYLELDAPFAFTHQVLDELAAHELHLVTLRRSVEALREQLERLDLARCFSCVLTDPERKADPIRTVVDGRPAVVVGDTEADVAAAREVGAVSVAVTSGVRDESVLERCAPDHLVEDIRSLPALLT